LRPILARIGPLTTMSGALKLVEVDTRKGCRPD